MSTLASGTVQASEKTAGHTPFKITIEANDALNRALFGPSCALARLRFVPTEAPGVISIYETPYFSATYYSYNYKLSSVSAARKIALQIIDAVNAGMNSESEVKKLFKKPAVDESCYFITLSFKKDEKGKEFLDEPAIAEVQIRQGLIQYFVLDKETGILRGIQCEMAEDARDKEEGSEA